MKQSKKISAVILFAITLIGTAWLHSLGSLGRWLFVHKSEAEAHASALLLGKIQRVPSELLDATFSSDSRVVVVSFHEQSSHEEIALFVDVPQYAADFAKKNGLPKPRHLWGHWYEIEIENK